MSGLTIPDVTSVDWDNPLEVVLLKGTETNDEEIESDGTTIAEIPIQSRLRALKLTLMVLGATSTTNVYRWILLKKPDGETLVSNATILTGNVFNSADNTPGQRENRKYVIAKGMVITNPNTAVTRVPVFIRKKALERIAQFKEDDTLNFLIAKDTAGTTSILHGWGNAYVRYNA